MLAKFRGWGSQPGRRGGVSIIEEGLRRCSKGLESGILIPE